MRDYSFIFATPQDALKVGEQLPSAEIVENHVFCADGRALKLAVALACVTGYVQEGAYCRLPYPRSEREYNGDSPSICVSCLSAYNSALLHWLWIDATQDADDILDDIQWMLSWSPVAREEVCEEYAIHDWENFHGISISEHEDLKVVSAIAKAIDEHGAAMASFIDWRKDHYINPDIGEIVEQFADYYCGHWDCEVDFVRNSDEIEEMFNWAGLEKDHLFWSYHINWYGVARDLFCSDYYSTRAIGEGYGVYVFRNF